MKESYKRYLDNMRSLPADAIVPKYVADETERADKTCIFADRPLAGNSIYNLGAVGEEYTDLEPAAGIDIGNSETDHDEDGHNDRSNSAPQASSGNAYAFTFEDGFSNMALSHHSTFLAEALSNVLVDGSKERGGASFPS